MSVIILLAKKNHFISYKLVNCEEIIGIDRRWKLLNAAKCLLGLRRGKVLGTDLVAHNLVHNLVVHNLAQPSARPSGAQASAQASAQPSTTWHNLARPSGAQPSARPSGAQLRLKKRRRADFPAGFKTHRVRESLADSIRLVSCSLGH